MEGKWISAPCWHDCGGRCLLKAYVKDGQVLRLKTDDTHEDSWQQPLNKACQRGFAQRQQIFGEDRLKYPMKRKHWSPENPNGHLRGKDEWERISWDEANRLIACEMKQIYEKYGPQSVLSLGGEEMQRVFCLMGGFTPRWGQVSWGAWPTVYSMVTGHKGFGFAFESPDRFTLTEQKLIIIWGANPAVSSAGNAERYYLEAKRQGAEIIVIDPRYTESIQPLNARWIPIRPATDTAMILGMIYHIVDQNLQDQAYLDRYCVGFDREHMPSEQKEGNLFPSMERADFLTEYKKIDPGDNLSDYLFAKGKFQREVPKTPEWAESICGVPAETIKELAEKYAGTKPATIISGGAPARVNKGESFPHALLTLGMVCGQIGREGASVCGNMYYRAANGGPMLFYPGGANVKTQIPLNPFSQKNYGINNGEMWNAVIEGKYTRYKGDIQYADIHMIFQGKGNALNQRAGMTRGIEAYRKVDFALTVNYEMTTSAMYSDIVLPCTTEWERPGTLLTGDREVLVYGQQVVKAQYECQSDQEIAKGIAKELGFGETDVYDIDEWQQLMNKLAGTEYLKPDGSRAKLLTITEEDRKRYEEKSGHAIFCLPQKGLITLKELEENGIFRIPSPEKYRNYSYKEFIEDPEQFPLNTPSGKFEIFSQRLSDYIRHLGFSEKSPLPEYEPVPYGYEDSKTSGYPFQFFSYHSQSRTHSVMDNISWLQSEFPQELWMNSEDAKMLSVESGESVILENPFGKIKIPVKITERIIPGAVALAQGAWSREGKDGIDEKGSANVLTAPIPTGQGHTGYNSVICRIRKVKEDGR